jgi:hypothetical protein
MAELKARIANLEKQEAERESMGGGNMVSFRGGYARNNDPRFGNILTDFDANGGNSDNGKSDGWYVGAGLDLLLSDDLFGVEDSIEVLGVAKPTGIIQGLNLLPFINLTFGDAVKVN